MSSFMDRYKTNKSAEEDGQWVSFGDEIQVKLRRINSKKSKEVRRRLEKPYAKVYRNGDIPESIQEELLNRQIAEAIVVDWKGVPDFEYKEGELTVIPDKFLDCTEDNVLRVIVAFPDFREDVMGASLEKATFQDEARKADEGNSENASNGN